MNTVAEIANVLKRLKSAVIFTHTRPDGDTLGSGLALSRALSILKIENEVVNDCDIARKFLFLEGAENIRKTPTLDAEAYICVDASDEQRLGELSTTFLRGAKNKITVNLDHHVSNTRFCRYNFVRDRSSNCENICELILAMGVSLDKQMATVLLAGMVTDSGAFSHSDVNGESLRLAALTCDAGADINAVQYEIFKKQSKARSQMYAKTISSLRYFLEDRLAIALVTQETLDFYGLKQGATEGIVDFALTVDTVEVSICLMELKKGQFKASLRSKGKVNVNEVARVYGGGGHILASGCMIYGDIEEVYDKLRYTVLQRLGE